MTFEEKMNIFLLNSLHSWN